MVQLRISVLCLLRTVTNARWRRSHAPYTKLAINITTVTLAGGRMRVVGQRRCRSVVACPIRYDGGCCRRRAGHWPQASCIHLSDQCHTLVMFAHPKCPCTRASLGELAKILTRCPNTVTPHVVFFKPSDTSEKWDHTDQWLTAAGTPGVNVIRDIDGVEASLFQATTSGQTLLYNAAGELLFSGGITLARGHAGDNPGRGGSSRISPV